MRRPVCYLKPILIALLIPYASALGQTQEPQQDVIRINTDLVVLDAQVLDKKTGAPLGNLKPSNFELREDGVRQEITYFSVDKLPLSIVLLLDVSPSVQPFIDQIRLGALQALQRLKPEDEVAVMVFAGTAQLIQGFTRDHQLIARQIERINDLARVKAGTHILRAINEAAKVTGEATSPAHRRVIITVTDNESFVPRGRGGVTVKEALDNLFESGGVVCGLIVRGTIARVQSVIRWYPPNLALSRSYKVDPFAEQTGGEMMHASKTEVDQKLGDLFEHLRTRYTLGFTSTNPSYDGKLRKLSLKVSPEVQKQPGEIIVRTRQGYYAKRIEKAPGEAK